MSGTQRIEDKQFGIEVVYDLTVNTALRLYNASPQNEVVPAVGDWASTLKGGRRVNGDHVPILDADKKPIGTATIILAISGKLDDIPGQYLDECGLETREAAMERAKMDEEFEASGGVVTIFRYRVDSLDNL